MAGTKYDLRDVEDGDERLGTPEDDQWKRIKTVERSVLVELIFETIDSDNDRMLDRKEVRYSPFGDALLRKWAELDTDQDQQITFEEWTGFFDKLAAEAVDETAICCTPLNL